MLIYFFNITSSEKFFLTNSVNSPLFIVFCFSSKKNEIFETKIEIQQDLAQIEEKGSAWLEPFREFVESALQAQKIARAKNTNEELAFFAKTVGSNFSLMNRQLSASFKTGFSELSDHFTNLPSAADRGDSFLVGVIGIEPTTSGPPALRSATELHPVATTFRKAKCKLCLYYSPITG